MQTIQTRMPVLTHHSRMHPGERKWEKELKKKIPSQEKGKALLPKALAELSFINIYKAFRDSQMEGTADMTGIITDLKRSSKQTKDFK